MSNSDKALQPIHTGAKIQRATFAEKMNPGIFGVGQHDQELAGRSLGELESSRYAGVLVSALNEMEKEGPGISAEALARLVDTRLRRLQKDPTPSDIAGEIESTLDLVEQCQWRLKLRKAEWRERTHKYFSSWLERPLTEEETKGRKRIEEQSYPLEFHRGLILIGVGGDNRRDREKRYWPCFRESWIANAMLSHQYGHIGSGGVGSARSLEDFTPPTDAEIREELRKQKKNGWLNKDWVLWQRERWQRWKIGQVKMLRSNAGKASGKARNKAGKGSR